MKGREKKREKGVDKTNRERPPGELRPAGFLGWSALGGMARAPFTEEVHSPSRARWPDTERRS